MTDDAYDFESLAVGTAADTPSTGARDIASPIHLSANFGLESAGYPEAGYTYSRFANPTRDALQDRLASLSNADHTLATASGMATIATVCLSLLRPGDRLIASDSLFGGTTTLFEELADRFGLDVSYVDATDLDAVADALDASTELVWVESPTNPLLRVCALETLGDLAADHGATFAVDNTFATPYGQRPLELGADVSVYSTTKFVNGHSDSVGGVLATDDDDLHEEFEFVLQELIGASMSPFDSYLVLRGVKTLPARLSVHEANATRVAEFLANHDAVSSVNYPGLPSHPQYDLATRQMDNFSGMVSFEVAGDAAEARALVEDLDVFNLAFSLGGVESLVEHTASMSAATLSAEERAEAGISDSLVRLSVGLESADDLIDDLRDTLRPI